MKMMILALTGLAVFVAAASGSWYVKTRVLAPPREEADVPTDKDLTAAALIPKQNTESGSDLMPVAVREETMSVEELLRFSLSLKERDRVLQEDEEVFRQKQVQQQLVLSDIQAEQKTIDDLRRQLSADHAATQDMIDELNRLRESVISERETTKKEIGDIESKRIDISEQYKTNDKKLSAWLQGMSGENAAAVLKEMANDGNMKMAVQLLSHFEEREAAKILDSISDPKLLNEFIAEFRNLKNAKVGLNPEKSKQ